MANWLRWTSKLVQTARNHPPGGVLIPNQMMPEFRHIRNESMSIEEHAHKLQQLRKEQMAEAARRGEPFPIGGGELQTYTITNGTAANQAVTAATFVGLVQTVTGASANNTWMAFDVSQDAALSATAPGSKVVVQLNTVAIGATAGTVNKLNGQNAVANASTAFINGTTNTGPAIYLAFFVPVTSGLSYQFPLGRELVQPISTFRTLGITGGTGVTGTNALGNVWIAE